MENICGVYAYTYALKPGLADVAPSGKVSVQAALVVDNLCYRKLKVEKLFFRKDLKYLLPMNEAHQ